jgi:TonB-linked SusC/RagA family outer membrane protein
VAGYDSQNNLVRGVTTMNGVSQPLFVIDGFPVENTRYTDYGSLEESIPNLNIEDIESITVLKDAAAASIYGARAANGVVVIVTKKAKAKRTSVSFSTSLTFHPYKFYKDRLASSADMIDLERQWATDNPNLQGDNAQSYAQSLLDNNVYTTQGVKAILNYYAGYTTQQQMESTLNDLASKGYRYYDDVAKYAKRDAFYQQYYINVGNSSEHNNFTASLTYRNNKMNDRYTSDNSWGVELKDRLDIAKWLHMEVGNYTYYKKAKTQTFDALSPGYTYMPYDQLKNDDGTNYTNTAADRLSSSSQAILNSYGLYSLDITPLDEISKNIRNTYSFVNRTYGKLDADLFPWLKYTVMFQYEYAYDKTKLLYDKSSYYVRSLVDQYATDDDGSGVATYNVPYGNIYYRVNQTSKSYTFRHQLNFDYTFAEKHNVVALFGHEVRKNVVDYDNSTLYNYDPDMLTYTLVNQSILNNTYGLMGGYGLQSNDFAYMRYVDNRYISIYANAAYTYDDRYMASASIRWDRSNLWGTNSKYQNKPIWSFGLGWNIDQEEWFKVSWIDRLKLRFSYGIAGNVAKDAAPYMTAYYYQNSTLGGTYGTIAGRPNPTLRWEKTTTTNIGIDFALLHNRINGSIEYYNKMGTDLLANTMGVPTEGFGYSTYKVNNGKMRNRGFEINLSGDIIATRDFGFSATATYSYNKNKVVYVNVEAPVYFLQLDYPEAYPVVGNAYNGIYGYRWAGLSSDGLPQVYDAEGNAVTYNPADLDAICYLGSTEPTSIASLTLNFRYKDFTASCLWTYQGGHKMRNTDLPMLGNSYNYALYSYVTALGPVNKGITERWRQSGDEATTNVPAAIFAENALFSSDSYDIYRYADINVIDASNLQLANISLAYNVPSVWLRPIHLSSARLQFNMENVCTFAHSKAAKYMLNGYDSPNYVLGIYIDF